MSAPDNRAVELAIRPDYREALDAALAAIGTPGPWLDGRTRVAIAEVTRYALGDDAPLLPWEAPSAVPGKIRQMTAFPLSPVAADAAYRLLDGSSGSR